MNKAVLIIISLFIFTTGACSQTSGTKIDYVPFFENVHHPEIVYWFFSKDMLEPDKYRAKIDSLSTYSKYTLAFLTARNGVNFYDRKLMHPIFKDVVKYAHSKGLKIGLQVWDDRSAVALDNTERLIQEGEVILDENGGGSFTTMAKYARDKKALIKSELFKVFAFKKTAEGFYDPSTLKKISDKTIATPGKEVVSVDINAGKALKGYTAYILTQHFYNYSSNHSRDAENRLVDVLKAYSDIAFDGVGLDEYTNFRVATTWELEKDNDVYRGRSYSLAMAKEFKINTGTNLDKALFDMRYAPAGKPEIRAKAINAYMSLMREGTMHEEKLIYKKGKELFGPNTFIGLHDTHHNSLDGDEVWQTGLNWWNVVRDYGQSDEGTPTPTQLGIGFGYKMNVMYNMYYNKSLENIVSKAMTDLRYGIRTHYHAVNDVQGWGVSVEVPASLQQINKVENAARLLNRFNPPFPQTKLLVVFGMEALVNWYPDTLQRSITDINNKLFVEQKAKDLWNAGYINALVPTDLIEDGRLTINSQGKPVLQGHTFDAMIFLYPQYNKERSFKFLEDYLNKGGKLMVEGSANYDYLGNDVAKRWKNIAAKAVVKNFSVADVSMLGIAKNAVKNGALNEDGSYTFTNPASLSGAELTPFSFSKNGVDISGEYTGMLAIKLDGNQKLVKLAATGFSSFKKNGEVILRLSKPADIYVEVNKGIAEIKIADQAKSVKVLTNKL